LRAKEAHHIRKYQPNTQKTKKGRDELTAGLVAPDLILKLPNLRHCDWYSAFAILSVEVDIVVPRCEYVTVGLTVYQPTWILNVKDCYCRLFTNFDRNCFRFLCNLKAGCLMLSVISGIG
jgi:hypothetical protein